MADSQNAPDKDKANEQTPPAGSDAGQGGSDTKAPSYKFKTQEEAERSYQDLEKKFGEHSAEVAEARKLRDQTDTMLRAVYADPDLYRAVENGIRKYTTGETVPETRTTPKKGDDSAAQKDVDPVIADMKKASENKIVHDFSVQYGYDKLDESKRKEAYTRLSNNLAEMLDPGGTRPIREVLSSIPLAKLPRFLEIAHKNANFDHIVEQRVQSKLSSRENDDAAIGSFASSSGNARGNTITLSNKEREIARKQGISEEDYAKRKGQIQAENSRFE